MNYLAHFFLADPNEDLMFGNYIGDGVRGSKFDDYPTEVVRGIRFHRHIDTFTDSHEMVKEAKKFFYGSQGKYSGVVVDVLFDHVLAKTWTNHHPLELRSFVQKCHDIIHDRKELLPIRSERFYYYIRTNDILENYAKKEGIIDVFRGMDTRTKFDSNMQESLKDFEDHQEEFESLFEGFLPDLIDSCAQWEKGH